MCKKVEKSKIYRIQFQCDKSCSTMTCKPLKTRTPSVLYVAVYAILILKHHVKKSEFELGEHDAEEEGGCGEVVG